MNPPENGYYIRTEVVWNIAKYEDKYFIGQTIVSVTYRNIFGRNVININQNNLNLKFGISV